MLSGPLSAASVVRISQLTRINVVWSTLTYVIGISLIRVHLVEVWFFHAAQLDDSIQHHLVLALCRIPGGLVFAIGLNLLGKHWIQMRQLWSTKKDRKLNLKFILGLVGRVGLKADKGKLTTKVLSINSISFLLCLIRIQFGIRSFVTWFSVLLCIVFVRYSRMETETFLPAGISPQHSDPSGILVVVWH